MLLGFYVFLDRRFAESLETLACLERQINHQGSKLKVMGVGTTGYAKDVLKEVLCADVALAQVLGRNHHEMLPYFLP